MPWTCGTCARGHCTAVLRTPLSTAWNRKIPPTRARRACSCERQNFAWLPVDRQGACELRPGTWRRLGALPVERLVDSETLFGDSRSLLPCIRRTSSRVAPGMATRRCPSLRIRHLMAQRAGGRPERALGLPATGRHILLRAAWAPCRWGRVLRRCVHRWLQDWRVRRHSRHRLGNGFVQSAYKSNRGGNI